MVLTGAVDIKEAHIKLSLKNGKGSGGVGGHLILGRFNKERTVIAMSL